METSPLGNPLAGYTWKFGRCTLCVIPMMTSGGWRQWTSTTRGKTIPSRSWAEGKGAGQIMERCKFDCCLGWIFELWHGLILRGKPAPNQAITIQKIQLKTKKNQPTLTGRFLPSIFFLTFSWSLLSPWVSGLRWFGAYWFEAIHQLLHGQLRHAYVHMILDSVVQSLAANENRTFTYVEQVGGPGRWGRGEAGSGDIAEMLLGMFFGETLGKMDK